MTSAEKDAIMKAAAGLVSTAAYIELAKLLAGVRE